MFEHASLLIEGSSDAGGQLWLLLHRLLPSKILQFAEQFISAGDAAPREVSGLGSVSAVYGNGYVWQHHIGASRREH